MEDCSQATQRAGDGGQELRRRWEDLTVLGLGLGVGPRPGLGPDVCAAPYGMFFGVRSVSI